MDGSGNAKLPCIVENRNGILKINACANGREVCAKDDENRACTSLAGHAHSALKQYFPADGEELLGLAQAAAFSSGEQDGGYSHRQKCNAILLTVR